MSLLAPELTDSGLWLIFNFSSRAAVSSSEQVVSRVVKQWSAPETQPDAAHIWHAPSPGLHHHYLPAQSTALTALVFHSFCDGEMSISSEVESMGDQVLEQHEEVVTRHWHSPGQQSCSAPVTVSRVHCSDHSSDQCYLGQSLPSSVSTTINTRH